MTVLPLYLLAIAGGCAGLEIAAFNVQVFGQTKFEKTEVVDLLSKIVQRYDIILIQEIRDATETIIHSFVEVLNSDTDSDRYVVVVSERLGRTSSKEQYAFIYRSDHIEVLDTFQYDDSAEDIFEREPFSVLVRSKNEDLQPFFLMGIHIQPKNAFTEINALLQSYEDATAYFGNENGIIMGDFNADCSYLSQTRFNMLSLVTDDRFTWLLTDGTITAVSSDCAYDRIVAAGDIVQSVVEGSGQVFLYDQEYSLEPEETKAVSDHYPVHFELQGSRLQGSNTGAAVGLHSILLSPLTYITIVLTTTVAIVYGI